MTRPDFIPGIPAGRFDWERMFRRVDRRGRWVRQEGATAEAHRVPGGRPVYPSMKDIGFAMATWANADGSSIYAGWRRLVVATSLHRATVIRGRQALQTAGWIQLTHRAGQEYEPRTFSNEYRLTVPAPYVDFMAELLLPAAADPPAAGDLPLAPEPAQPGTGTLVAAWAPRGRHHAQR